MQLNEFDDPASYLEFDSADRLAKFRKRFHFPQTDHGDAVYFTGNSLGLMPKTVREYVEQELADWERLAVEGHVHAKNPWVSYHEFLTERMAAIIGAKPTETVVMNALTVNLHLLLVSFYPPTASRYKIVIEKGAFPSDQYAVTSQLEFHGRGAEPPAVAGGLRRPNGKSDDNEDQPTFRARSLTNNLQPPADAGGSDLVELTPRDGESTLRTADILETIERDGDSIALILLGGVNYYTGQAFDMQAITEAGHKVGAVVGFDLAHAAGNIELKMHDWDVDFAAWCSYKYLNGGPGAVGGAFVHERHARNFDLPRFAGWWGHDKETRFLMDSEFVPIAGAEGWQLSNQPILLLASLRASLDIFAEAGMPNLIEKSHRLTGYLEFLLGEIHDERISVITPQNPHERGCQLSIRVADSDKSLFKVISDKGVIADWREPDVIRVAPVPLYNSYTDVYKFARILKDSLV